MSSFPGVASFQGLTAGGNNLSGLTSWKSQTQISPIILTGGSATAQGGAIPISSLINPAISDDSTNPQLDGTGADFMPVTGGTLISNQVATYPFANQAVAANAVIAQPLTISMSMLIPATINLPYPARQALMIAFVNALKQHILLGGLFSVITSAYIYTNTILTMMRDVSGGETNQPQYRWQFDFFQPLVTQQAATQAQNGLMQTLSNGTPIAGTPSWSSGLPVSNPTNVPGLVPSPASPPNGGSP